MILLQPVQPNDRDQRGNINQKYLYEMTVFYPDEMDAGNLLYGHFEEYLVSAHQRIDFAEGADFAPPRRGTCSRLEFYAASSCTSTRSNDATPSGASTK